MIRINAQEPNVNQIRQLVRQLLKNWTSSPLVTLRVAVEYARDNLLIQRNRVRNGLTGVDDDRMRVVLSRPDRCSVLVIPLLPDNRVVLSVRYCYAAARWSLVLPRLDEQDQDEGWGQAARRCLAEGTGMVTDQWCLVGNAYVDPNWSPTLLYLVLAKNCRRPPAGNGPVGDASFVDTANHGDYASQAIGLGQDAKLRPDANLVAGTVAVGGETLDEMIRDGDIECGATLAGLAMLRAQGWK